MGSEIYPEVHENPRAFFSSSSLILLEPLAHGSSDWSLPREDCIRLGFQRGFVERVLKFLAKIVKIDHCPDFLEFIKGI